MALRYLNCMTLDYLSHMASTSALASDPAYPTMTKSEPGLITGLTPNHKCKTAIRLPYYSHLNVHVLSFNSQTADKIRVKWITKCWIMGTLYYKGAPNSINQIITKKKRRPMSRSAWCSTPPWICLNSTWIAERLIKSLHWLHNLTSTPHQYLKNNFIKYSVLLLCNTLRPKVKKINKCHIKIKSRHVLGSLLN